MDNNTTIKPTELLALERTKLANERTLLAYFRTFVVFLSSGLAIIKIDIMENMITFGYILTVFSVLIISTGIIRFFYMKKKLNKLFNVKSQLC